MADVYDRYLRLRLLDVVLKRGNSSKVASCTVPMDKVRHLADCVYEVEASNCNNMYTVDLAIGTCSCPIGDTGAICKHQLAASQFSAVRLPQMFGCSPQDKYLLSKIVYGNSSSYTIDFFRKLGEESEEFFGTERAAGNLENGIVCKDNGEEVSVEETEPKEIQRQDGATLKNKQDDSVSQEIKECARILTEKLQAYPSLDVQNAVQIFIKRIRSVSNPSQLCTFLCSAGASLHTTSGSVRRKILCQPTSIARRQSHQPRGKAALLRGRIIKRKRNLSIAIKENIPNAKPH